MARGLHAAPVAVAARSATSSIGSRTVADEPSFVPGACPARCCWRVRRILAPKGPQDAAKTGCVSAVEGPGFSRPGEACRSRGHVAPRVNAGAGAGATEVCRPHSSRNWSAASRSPTITTETPDTGTPQKVSHWVDPVYLRQSPERARREHRSAARGRLHHDALVLAAGQQIRHKPPRRWALSGLLVPLYASCGGRGTRRRRGT